MCASKTIVCLALVLSLGLFLVLWRFYPRGPETNSFSVENPLPENDSVPVAAIFENILVSKTYRVVGLEYIPHNGARYFMPNSPELVTALAKVDITTLVRLITEETDYECLNGNNFFIIYPKDDPAKHETDTSKLVVRIDRIDNAPFMEVLDRVNKLNMNGRYLVLGPSWPMGPLKTNSISLNAGYYRMYDLLNEMAMQLQANCWEIDHLPIIYKGPYQPVLPIILNPGNVFFGFQN